jgi:hypothetical protein
MKKILVASMLLFSSLAFADHHDECFDANFVSGWEYDDATETLLLSSFGDTYAVETVACFELPWAHAIGFDAFFGSQVCRGDKVLVFDAFGDFKDSCLITGIKKQ